MKEYFRNGRAVLDILQNHGYKAFFVGGAVRDYLLKIEPNDIDIATEARPDQIEKIFSDTKATGKRYGTITVFYNEDKFEVTTFRADLQYIDFRHPERVVFSDSVETDLERRDFTINALAMDAAGDIIDLFAGRTDMKNRLIRAINDPDVRFTEDALRMLRAFRFVAKLDFQIETDTLASIRKNIGLLKHIANERIISEFKEIFKYPHYQNAIKILSTIPVDKVFSELAKGIELLADKTDYDLQAIDFFALCFYASKAEIPSYWRFSNKERNYIEAAVKLVDEAKNGFDSEIVFAHGVKLCLKANHIGRLLGLHDDAKRKIKNIDDSLPIHAVSELDFDGHDVMEILPEKDGRVVGEILNEILKDVINGKLKNDREEIKNHLLRLLEK